MSLFFPSDARLVGPEVDAAAVKAYLARVAELMSHAQAEVAVLGSAAARNVPDGFERARAEDQLVEAFSWAADAFEGSGTTIAIEPQRRQETTSSAPCQRPCPSPSGSTGPRSAS
jgi:hydroxypyruvate isomerase